MNKVIQVFNFMKQNEEIKKNVISMKEKDYESNETLVNASYAVMKNIVDLLAKVDKEVLFVAPKVDHTRNKLISLEKYITNSYTGINTNLVYDFFALEYEKLENNLKELLSI